MVKHRRGGFALSAWAFLILVEIGGSATAALDGEAPARLAEATAVPAPMLGGAATLAVRFVQEGGPEAGSVRVVLTPETRPITVLEARSAAQEAFLDALNEPGLGDGIRRVKVVVRLMPAESAGADLREEVFVFVHKGGSQWSVLAGD